MTVEGVVTVATGVWHDNANYFTIVTQKNSYRFAGGHAGGIEVNAWTVNSTADMMACIALGVDYITTDNPATLKKLLETPFVTAPK